MTEKRSRKGLRIEFGVLLGLKAHRRLAALDPSMTITREQEVWAMALWVDREHGEDAECFIAERVLHFEETGETGGKDLWMRVARRYVDLRDALTAEPN